MDNNKAAEMLAWYSLAPEEVYEVAYYDLHARDAAAHASTNERDAILQSHETWAQGWLEAGIGIFTVGQWIQKQLDNLPVNKSQFAAEALVTTGFLNDQIHEKKFGAALTREKIQRLALASLDIRSGKSAFVKRK
ncbi:MAG TPA: hypothetical protein VLF90_02790 [Patescibacteria group bacterium]|nr:hypothetical protein [Patescibacteria group bacterium]